MEWHSSSKPELVIPQKPKTDSSAPSKRRMSQKTVMKVKIEANSEQHKGSRPPCDSWSWRKYGQKPIKGSPYPRGYYKCSTSKGCSAKKQVERCRTDASILIITYTSTHNHPTPVLPKQLPPNSDNDLPIPSTPTPPIIPSCQDQPNSKSHSSPQAMQTVEVEAHDGNDFFDELEELVPISYSPLSTGSCFTSFLRNSFFEDRALLPS